MPSRAHFEGPAAPAAAPEFSRLVRLGQVGRSGLHKTISATPEERRALERRFDLSSLDRLEADVTVEALGRGGIYRVYGRFEADLAQFCVVTTDPVPAHLAETFEAAFSADPAFTEAGPIEVDVDAEDPPEPIEGDAIDIGEAVVQQFAVSLDPYPRAPSADEALPAPDSDKNEAAGGADDAAATRPNPFAALAHLKRE